MAMRIACGLILPLRIKLKMFVRSINGPANMLCDNNRMAKNACILEPPLFKKHDSINYHIVWESAVAGIMRVAKEEMAMNLADAFTKLVPYTRKQETISQVLWDC